MVENFFPKLTTASGSQPLQYIYTDLTKWNGSSQAHKSTSLFLYTDLEKEKSLLVARGFQDQMDEVGKFYAPTISKGTMRSLLSLCGVKAWTLNVIDVTTAVLQAPPIQRDVYLQPPPAAKEPLNHVWKLNVMVYGLTDARKAWFKNIKRKSSSP